MRFSYIDSQGKEIEVDSVESLALRIELGAIKPDTRMYDAVADRWAPAEEHPVFRSLSRGEEIEEDEIVAIGEDEAVEGPVAGPVAAEESEEGEEPEGTAEEAELEEEEPEEGEEPEGEEAEQIEGLDELEPLELEAPEEAAAGREPVTGGSPASAASPSEERGEGLESPEEPAGELEAPEEAPTELEAPEEPAAEAKAPDETAEETAEEEPLPRPTWVDEGEELWEEEEETEDGMSSGDGGGMGWDGHREALEEDLADPRRQMPEWAAVPEEEPGTVEVEPKEEPRDVREEIEDRSAPPRPAHWDERRRARARRSRWARIGQVAVVLLLGAGAGYFFLASPGGIGSEEGVEIIEPPLPPDQWAAMATAANRAWNDVVREFRSAIPGYGLPYRPPAAWLEGIYLSNASNYPGVANYWEDVENTIEALRTREGQLYFQHLNRHLDRMAAASAGSSEASEAVSAGSVPQILSVARAEYERTAPGRDSAYQALFDVAAASLGLHEFLIEREADILYEPFTDPNVSRDPVLEAVPVDSVLRVEMNANLDRVIEAITGNGIPRPITTTALFNHLLTDLSRTETASDTPPPPDTIES